MNIINPVASGQNVAAVARPAPVSTIDPNMATTENPSSDARAQSGTNAEKPQSTIKVEQRLPDNKVIFAGPSPAFEASLLELDADIDKVIKRVHADREKARNGDAVSADPAEPKVAEATQAISNETIETNPYDSRSDLRPTEA